MSVFANIKQLKFLNDLSHLVYPNLCLVCEKELSINESHICTFCNKDLALTSFHLYDEATSMDKLFWGRIQIHKTYTHLFFEKDKASQTILFNLKYKNSPQLGVYFGKEIGRALKTLKSFNSVDAYIPVPLHPKKAFIRGYNQSEVLAKGICETLNAKLDVSTIIRTKHSETQTKKSRFQRWENVNEVFKVKKAVLSYKHIVLVDDVITTGSTIESVAQTLLKKNPDLLISVVTLAIA